MIQRSPPGVRRFSSAGFALVELLVALAVGLFLTAGILQVLLSSQTSFRAEQNFSHLQENGRYAVQLLAREARMSRSLGCSSLRLDEARSTLNTQACVLRASSATCSGDSFVSSTTPLGYDADFNSATPRQRGSWASLPENVRDRWVRGDVLAVWGVFGAPSAVSVTTASGTDPADPVELVTSNPDIGSNDLALITDCESTDVFFVTDLQGADKQLVHGVLKATSPDLGSQVNVADPNDAGRAPLSRSYNAAGTSQVPGVQNKAMVYPFDYRVYYVCCRDDEDGSLTDSPASCRAASRRYRPSLCRWSANSGRSDQLVPDVADLRVTFSGDADGNGRIDFVNADAESVTAAGNWPHVYSAEIELLATSEDDQVAATAATPSDPAWPGGDDRLGAGLTADGRLYERFDFTVALRARAPWYVQR